MSTADKSREFWDCTFGKNLADVDPDVAELIGFEEERQCRKLIMIPSESYCPRPVREALGSVFNNVYAEGYPRLAMMRDDSERLLQFDHELAHYRRYADRRFYKGVDYVDLIECLAQRRVAECFANDRANAEEILVNVQPLSGSPANLAVYEALLAPGDTIMGMALPQGGHLTHGSPFNISGRRYRVVSYAVSSATGKLDYDAIGALAREHKPKIIVAGFTSYSWAPDWEAFRAIADEVGAFLMADIAHTAGMALAGAYPNPVGIADIITLTTHKTLFGPRGAVIMTTNEDLATVIDNSVFPGRQGGPHPNKFAALAVAARLAQSEEYRKLQHRIVDNAVALADGLRKRGLKLAYGGTNTHLLVIDLNPLKSSAGFPLKGEIAARILDLAGIVVNKNTIPGDVDASEASGIRLGTPWLTQRGMGVAEMDKIADLVQRILVNITPFQYQGLAGPLWRGKIDLDTLEQVKAEVAELARGAVAEIEARGIGYPHYYTLHDQSGSTADEKSTVRQTALLEEHTRRGAELSVRQGWTMALHYHHPEDELKAAKDSAALLDLSSAGLLELSGKRVEPFLEQVCTNRIAGLRPGESQRSFLLNAKGQLLDDISVMRLQPDAWQRDGYLVMTNPANTERVKAWFRGLSDGYVVFDEDDVFRKVEGPVVVTDLGQDVETRDRRVALALCGPQSIDALNRANAETSSLRSSPFWEGELNGQQVSVHKADERFIVLVFPDKAGKVWECLIEAGATPAGATTADALRSEAGLPQYNGSEPKPDGLSLYRAGHKSWFHVSKPYFVGQNSLTDARPEVKKDQWQWSDQEGDLKRTVLYQEHIKLTRKMVPFGGWEMPVWYASVREEHRAVRETAGLFDVAHMGVLEVTGEHATHFLDLVASNYVRWLEEGHSQYAYLLDPDGNVIDDIMVYRRARDRYMVVVNASNAEKDLAWLYAVNSGRCLTDRLHPDTGVEAPAVIRDLKDPSSGDDQKVDLALQGPNSLAILQSLTEDRRLQATLARIRRTEFIETELAGASLIVSRTGYTGEDVAFELYLHPDEAPRIWNLLLEKGKVYGVKPAGLGARDSTRTEAGLPLYGHDLAGSYNISPIEAGFASYVKFHKPYFIGRKALLQKEASRKMEILRFRMNEKGVRMTKLGDLVVDKRGKLVGHVTSCALDTAGFQIGLAYADRKYNREDAQIGIIALPHGGPPPAVSVEQMDLGDKMLLQEKATVLPRFPLPEEPAARSVSLE